MNSLKGTMSLNKLLTSTYLQNSHKHRSAIPAEKLISAIRSFSTTSLTVAPPSFSRRNRSCSLLLRNYYLPLCCCQSRRRSGQQARDLRTVSDTPFSKTPNLSPKLHSNFAINTLMLQRLDYTTQPTQNVVDMNIEINVDEQALRKLVNGLSDDATRTLLKITLERMESKGVDFEEEFTSADANDDNVLSMDEFQNWMKSRINRIDSQTCAPVTFAQYRSLYLRAAIPFGVFGFVDNFVMIMVGETIDLHLGISFGISTMAAAGFGNMMSDVVGTGFGSLIQTFSDKLRGSKKSQLSLTPEQLALRSVKWTKNFACISGIAFGCLLGMFPLLFY